MSATDRILVVLGSGPGIGVGVASYFASKSFNRVALLSRNAERLQVDAKSVLSAAKEAGAKEPTVKTYSVDLSDSFALTEVLNNVEKELGTPEVVIYNASLVGPSKFFAIGEDVIEKSFKISVTGLYTTAKWAIPHLTALSKSNPEAKPSLLITSGGLYKDPWAPFFNLSLAKAAQFSLTMTLSQEFAKQGVHVAAVVVHGLVRPESEYFSPRKIAEVFWGLYEQGAKGEKEVWVKAPVEDEASKKWVERFLADEGGAPPGGEKL